MNSGPNAQTRPDDHTIPQALTGNLGTILLVEDEGFVRDVTCELLQSEGFRVLDAGTAREAALTFHQNRDAVALLISDVVLPDRNGYDLASELRATSPALPVIFISGYFENGTRVKRGKGCMDSYLPKPFSADGLIKKVMQVLFGVKEESLNRACDSLQPV